MSRFRYGSPLLWVLPLALLQGSLTSGIGCVPSSGRGLIPVTVGTASGATKKRPGRGVVMNRLILMPLPLAVGFVYAYEPDIPIGLSDSAKPR